MGFKIRFLSNKIVTGFMTGSNLMFATVATLAASIKLYENKENHEVNLYLTLAIIMGLLNFVIATVLIISVVKGSDRYIFIYLILELSNLIILTIFAGINAFHSIGIGLLFLVCIIDWYGLYCIYCYYLELADFNNVKSGVIEISCNTDQVDPVMFPEKAVESTAV